jgi:hypothetical protein
VTGEIFLDRMLFTSTQCPGWRPLADADKVITESLARYRP